MEAKNSSLQTTGRRKAKNKTRHQTRLNTYSPSISVLLDLSHKQAEICGERVKKKKKRNKHYYHSVGFYSTFKYTTIFMGVGIKFFYKIKLLYYKIKTSPPTLIKRVPKSLKSSKIISTIKSP